MDSGTVRRIERSVERVASALFAGAIGFATYVFLRPFAGVVQLRLLAGLASVAGFICSETLMLALSRRRSSFAAPMFDLREVELPEVDELLLVEHDRAGPAELVLTDADRIDGHAVENSEEPLMLDDVLARLQPDSRVVRLFDRDSMPTPGELQSKIDDHLGHRRSVIAPDASHALREALSELRRSIR